VSVDFTNIDSRLEWANEQIANLEARYPAFRERKPHEVLRKPNPESTDRADLVLQINEPAATAVIREVAMRAGDVVHSLRVALDYLAFAVVPVPTTDTAFPVWRSDKIPTPTTAQWKGCVLGKVKGAPFDCIKLCLTLQPYFGGNHELIRVLDYLDIVDKHRLIIGAFASYESLNFDAAGMLRGLLGIPVDLPEMRIGFRPAERFPLQNGYVLFTASVNEMDKMNAQPMIEIALGEPPPLLGRSVVPALTELAEFVSDLIDQFRRLL
jgi:hypothetical protein